MGNPSNFFLIVDQVNTKKSCGSLLDISRERGEVNKQPGRLCEIALHSMIYVLFQPTSTHSGNSKIELRSNATLSGRQQLLEFFNFCFDVCTKIDPLYALADSGIGVYDYGPAWCAVEHYRNPYFFCLEPKKERHGYDPAVDFIADKALLNRISEIQKVMSIDELVNLLRKHCVKVAVGPSGGVTVWKAENGGTASAVGLRYFLAQEVRRRGVQLAEGSAEKYAKELGIK